jgi:hypothetical protein|nr:MAG TPA: hypothetical protein [Caudoviricetes sp.]
MLKLTKGVTLTGAITIDDKLVINVTATIPESGSPSSNKVIFDTDLYLANQVECDSDVAAFEDALNKELKERVSE